MALKKRFKILILIIVILILSILSSLSWIYISTKKNIYSNISELPYNRVGLIPGCNKYISTGVLNRYYIQRINAGVKLFNQGKIDYILVSGDNAHASYDEPREMRNSLVEAGIPNDKIYSDYAGFRTLDTIVRAREVFQLKDVTFISQNFHNQRGVFIGNHRNIKVDAFNVGSIDLKFGYKTEIREIFAKVKMLIDLYILDKEPKFLGDQITIGDPI
ncbi:MAG: YdcF family protein [Spirochaetaceae bacterium]